MHSITRKEASVTAVVTGRLNREEAETLVRDVEKVLQDAGPPAKYLFVNMSRVEYLSSTGLGAMVRMFRAASEAKLEMIVCCGRPEIRSLIEIAGLDRLIRLIDRPDEYRD